ncbi:hypothetical protein FRB90_007134 [Tulasnella sp. 427]|nr:hypothetical protein FRB90_007134 [Tulasnella sp. 427]
MSNHQPPPDTSKSQPTTHSKSTSSSASEKVYQDTFGRAFSDAHSLSVPTRPPTRRTISSTEFFIAPPVQARDHGPATRTQPSVRRLSADSFSSSAQTSPEVDRGAPSFLHHHHHITNPAQTDDENTVTSIQPTRLFASSERLPLPRYFPETPSSWSSSQSSTSTPITWTARGLGIRRDLGFAGVSVSMSTSNSFLAQVAARSRSGTPTTPSQATKQHDSDFEDVFEDSDDEEFEGKFDGEMELSDGDGEEGGELGTSLSGRTLIDDAEAVGEPGATSTGKGKEVDRTPPEESREVVSVDQVDCASTPSSCSPTSTPQSPPSRSPHARSDSLVDHVEDTLDPSASAHQDALSRSASAASVASTRRRIEFLIHTPHGSKRCVPGEDDSSGEEEEPGPVCGAGPSTRAPLTPAPTLSTPSEGPIIPGAIITSQAFSDAASASSAVDIGAVAHVFEPPYYEHREVPLETIMGHHGAGEVRDLPEYIDEHDPDRVRHEPNMIAIAFPSHYGPFHQLGQVLHGIVQYWQDVVAHGVPLPTPLSSDPSWEIVADGGCGREPLDLGHRIAVEVMIVVVWYIIAWLELVEYAYCTWVRYWYGRHVRMRV